MSDKTNQQPAQKRNLRLTVTQMLNLTSLAEAVDLNGSSFISSLQTFREALRLTGSPETELAAAEVEELLAGVTKQVNQAKAFAGTIAQVAGNMDAQIAENMKRASRPKLVTP